MNEQTIEKLQAVERDNQSMTLTARLALLADVFDEDDRELGRTDDAVQRTLREAIARVAELEALIGAFFDARDRNYAAINACDSRTIDYGHKTQLTCLARLAVCIGRFDPYQRDRCESLAAALASPAAGTEGEK